MNWKSTLLLLAIISAFLLVMLGFQGKKEQEQQDRPEQSSSNISKDVPSLIRGEITGQKLMVELACNACHSGVSDSLIISNRAPSLNYAGERYNQAYLFEWLQSPKRVRYHIGHSRMPDFQLSEEESLALTLYLSQQKNLPQPAPKYPKLSSENNIIRGRANLDRGKSLMDKHTCFTCHTLNGTGNLLITDLSNSSQRLKADWMQKYMAAPSYFTGNNLMPHLFYRFNADRTLLLPLFQNPEEDIKDIAAYLFSLNKKEKSDQEARYEAFKKKNKDISAEMGEKIYLAQNCSACHNGPVPNNLNIEKAPDLALEGQRVQKEWLSQYLNKPTMVRPFGFHPGSGSRMPDFRLTPEEIALISNYLNPEESAENKFASKKLSAFSSSKAEKLLNEKLPCTGCHQLNGEGGKIGPSFDQIPNRLKADYVYNIIKNTHTLIPKTMMPRIPMPEQQLELIVNYLIQDKPRSPQSYTSLINQEPYFFGNFSDNKGLYLKYCASCHGLEGNGDGYNAINLPLPPTVHANSEYMTLRTDATLYDGIYAGGYMLNKSNRMPAYGYTLDNEQIKSLVSYLRELCECEGPSWSFDN